MVSRFSLTFSDRGLGRCADQRLVKGCHLKLASVAKTEGALTSSVSVSVPVFSEVRGTPRLSQTPFGGTLRAVMRTP